MKAEFAAFKTALGTPTVLAGRVHTALRVKDGNFVRDNYAVAFPAVPVDFHDERFTALQLPDSDRFFSIETVFVAVDPDGVLTLAEAAVTQLLGKPLAIEGRRGEEVSLADASRGERSQWDPAANLHYMRLWFEFWSRRA